MRYVSFSCLLSSGKAGGGSSGKGEGAAGGSGLSSSTLPSERPIERTTRTERFFLDGEGGCVMDVGDGEKENEIAGLWMRFACGV